MTWILILFAHVGPFANNNSNAITTQEFNSQAACQSAGNAASNLVRGTVKEITFVCVNKG